MTIIHINSAPIKWILESWWWSGDVCWIRYPK